MAKSGSSKTSRRRRHRWRWPLYVVALLFASLVGVYLYFTHPARIVSMAQTTLSRITGASVEIDSAHFELDGPITLYGVHMRVPDVPGQPDGGDRLFDCESVVIEHRLAALLTGGLDIESVQFRRPIFYPTEHVDDGKFTLQYLKPEKKDKKDKKKKRSKQLPDIHIEGAHIVFGEIVDGEYKVLQSIRLNADLMRQSELVDDYRFALTRNETDGEQPLRITGLFNLVDESMAAEVMLGAITKDDPRIKLMPRNVRQLLERLKPSGNLSLVKFGYTADTSVTAELTLDNGSLEFPWGETVLPLDQSSGTLTISENEHIDVNLKGRARGSSYFAEYTVKGTGQGLDPKDAMFEVNVTLKGQVTDKPEDMDLLPGPLRFLFERYGPQGDYEINAIITRGSDRKEIVTSGTCKLIDGSVLYEHLPYPLEHVSTNIAFDADQVVIDGLVGVGPPDQFGRRARFRINGSVISPGRSSGVNVDINIDGMPLNNQLFDAMSSSERKAITPFFDQAAYVRLTAEQGGVIQSMRQKDRRGALIAAIESQMATLKERGDEGVPQMAEYQQRVGELREMVQRPVFDLGGSADLLVELRRAPGDPKIRTTLTAHSDGVFAMYEHWPYPLKVTAGKIVVDTLAPRVDAIGLVAESVGGGKFMLNGALLPPADGSRVMTPDIDIVATDMPVDDVLFAVIPDQYAKWLRDLRFKGKWAAKGKIDQSPKGQIEYGFDVQFDRAIIQPWGGNYHLDNVVGSLRIDRKGLVIDEVTARHGDSVLSFKASTGSAEEAGLTLSGKNVRFDDPIIELLPPDSNQYKELKQLFDDHKPQGVFDFEVSQTASESNETDYRVTLSPKTLAFTLKEQRIDLKSVTGDVIASGKNIAFKQFAAEFGAGKFDVNGSMMTGEAFRCELLFNVAADNICPVAKTVLPEAVINAVKAIEIDGPYQLKQASLAIDQREGSERPLAFNSSLLLKDAKANLGVAITELSGKIDIDVSLAKDQSLPRVNLAVSNASLRAGDRRIESLGVKLSTADKPGLIKVTGLKGKSYGGSIVGEGYVQAADKDSTYRLTLSLQEVMLDAFLNPLDPKYVNFKLEKDDNQTAKRERVAVLSASLSLEGTTSDPTSRRGRGNMSVADATLYETPVGFAVLQLLNLSLPSAKSFDRMQATYLIDGDTVRFDKIEFLSKALKISGAGTMKYSTQELDLTLVSANPSGIDLGPLTDVLNLLKDELISLRVTGTLSKPKSGIQSLKGLRNSVDDVLGEPKNKKPDNGAKPIQPDK